MFTRLFPMVSHPTFALFDDGLQGDLLNPYISQVGNYVDKMLEVSEGKKPLFMVLQGFSWEMLKERKKPKFGNDLVSNL